jgi:sporulation protein YlmC with PRC-barrel domain
MQKYFGEILSIPRKSTTRDKLVGMKVIDAEGNILGTVKDLSFTVGKLGVSLNVEDKDGQIRDIPWENIQGVGDFVILKPTAQSATETSVAAQTAQPTQQICPTCRGPLSYIQQYQRWYCYKCQKYV